jgi:hypothetical protein
MLRRLFSVAWEIFILARLVLFFEIICIGNNMGLESNIIPLPESASELRLSAKLVPTFVDRGRHVVSVTDPYGRILGFLDRSRYFFFQVAPQL